MTQVTITATYITPAGGPASGRVTFMPRVPIMANPVVPTFYTGPITASLDATGSISVSLLASDTASLNPSGWTYIVHEDIYNRESRSYDILGGDIRTLAWYHERHIEEGS